MLHILERLKVLLLTERRSRLGEESQIAELSTIPDDGLQRVFVGEVYRGSYEAGPIVLNKLRTERQLCMQILQTICEPSDVLWCFGERNWYYWPLDDARLGGRV
ncbi:MAG: hypothetical protein JWL77_3179 [Chthonomonadaceae bacterium]|nr:hypothetical protein [Chthonomonadaceae bacterium]